MALWADAATWNFDGLTFFFTFTSLHFAQTIKNNERFIEKFYQRRRRRRRRHSFKCATHTHKRAPHHTNQILEINLKLNVLLLVSVFGQSGSSLNTSAVGVSFVVNVMYENIAAQFAVTQTIT